MELGQSSVVYRSELVFTPFRADRIDEAKTAEHLDRWIGESGVVAKDFAAGGVIITGLAAQKGNVAAIEALVKQRVSEALFATADDPCLESWLAFMGSCYELSRAQPDTYFLNLDIGGGTTNLALGRNGVVLRTGCLFAGARHFQFEPGGYRITAMSPYAIRLLGDLKIDKSVGGTLAPDELQRVLDFYVTLTEAAASGDRSRLERDQFRYHVQVPFDAPADTRHPHPHRARVAGVESASPQQPTGSATGVSKTRPQPPDGVLSERRCRPPAVITLSGGVGELVYNHIRGRPLPPTTAYGDLGIDLARGIIHSPVLSRHLHTHVPLHFGHATVYGLSLHSTEVSGTTLYLPDSRVLPLRDLPIVAKLRMQPAAEELSRAIELVGRSARGGCVAIEDSRAQPAAVRQLGAKLAAEFRANPFPEGRPIVLFVSQNVGKTIGSYATDWGRLPVRLIVIDELVHRNARFASLGALHNGVVPVSFYGMREPVEDHLDEIACPTRPDSGSAAGR
jgi:ethanolamine utilization protein EutA